MISALEEVTLITGALAYTAICLLAYIFVQTGIVTIGVVTTVTVITVFTVVTTVDVTVATAEIVAVVSDVIVGTSVLLVFAQKKGFPVESQKVENISE